jgi:hypothetical protein
MTATLATDQFLDPLWRLSNLYTIVNKDGKAVRFEPNWAQIELLQGIHNRNLILKARQLGFTTLCCLIYLDDCLFNANVQAAVIAHKLDDAKIIFKNKVKFPYDNLDEGLRAAVPLTQDSADTLALANGSSIRVSTSTRSGTVNWLHVSEYGKICAQFPDKAREIKTGAFPSAERGTITIESTAEGEDGDFYDKSQLAKALADAGADLTNKDFKFFFFPWWAEKSYAMPRSSVPASPIDTAYFERIENEAKTKLSPEQRNWWLSQERDLGGDMKREYPATPQEAFEQALEGAIFADDIAIAYKHERIGKFPINPSLPLNTFWDLGFSAGNETAIWLEQDFGMQPTMVGYYENSGEQIQHYINWLKLFAAEHGLVFGKHYMPHDGDRQSIWLPDGSMGVMAKLGFNPVIVERHPDKIEAIRIGRRKFGQIAIDEAGCKVGLTKLKRYRKEWDERRGVWREHPHHGPESNGADAYLTYAQSGHTPMPPKTRIDRYRSYEDADEGRSAWTV